MFTVAEREIKLDAEDLLRRLGLAIKRIKELEDRSHFLFTKFIEAMNDIGRYGHEKYGERSFHHRVDIGDRSRDERTRAFVIYEHADGHFDAHLRGILHDHFNTRKHQLAAVAFNAMMEFHFAGLDMDPWEL